MTVRYACRGLKYLHRVNWRIYEDTSYPLNLDSAHSHFLKGTCDIAVHEQGKNGHRSEPANAQ